LRTGDSLSRIPLLVTIYAGKWISDLGSEEIGIGGKRTFPLKEVDPIFEIEDRVPTI
jgi:hypothetical protein